MSGSELLVEALDPVMVAAGFLAGQGGSSADGSGQVIYCIGHDELARLHPRLPQASVPAHSTACDDLVVDLGPGSTLGRLHLEGHSLVATLRHVGLDDDADAVAACSGRPVTDVVPVLAAALRRLLDVRP